MIKQLRATLKRVMRDYIYVQSTMYVIDVHFLFLMTSEILYVVHHGIRNY